jgi:hypothetical protein
MRVSGEQQGNKMKIEISFDTPDQLPKFQELFLDLLKKLAGNLDAGIYNVNGEEVNNIEDGYTTGEIHQLLKDFSNWL